MHTDTIGVPASVISFPDHYEFTVRKEMHNQEWEKKRNESYRGKAVRLHQPLQLCEIHEFDV